MKRIPAVSQSITQLSKRLLTSRHAARRGYSYLWHLRSLYFDWHHNVDTAGWSSLDSLKIDSGNAQFGGLYEAVGVKAARNALNLQIDHRKYTFIDFGSGKGRVLFMASDYPYRKIIGVEFADELHQAALQNISTFRSRRQRCRDIEAVHMDAAEFPLPATPLVLHFFNPFGPTVMSTVVANIQASLGEHPRDAILIYHSPRHAGMMAEMKNIQVMSDAPWLKVYRIPGPAE